MQEKLQISLIAVTHWEADGGLVKNKEIIHIGSLKRHVITPFYTADWAVVQYFGLYHLSCMFEASNVSMLIHLTPPSGHEPAELTKRQQLEIVFVRMSEMTSAFISPPGQSRVSQIHLYSFHGCQMFLVFLFLWFALGIQVTKMRGLNEHPLNPEE